MPDVFTQKKTEMAQQKKLKSWKYKGDWPIIREVEKGGKLKYRVDTTTKLGRRERPVRNTKQEAELLCEQYRIRLKNEGTRGFELDAQEQADAQKAMSIARDLGFGTLTDAIEKLAVYHRPAGGDCTVRKLRETFLEHYENQYGGGVVSLRTLRSYRNKTEPLLAKFGRKQVRELTGDVVWGELKLRARRAGWSRGTLDSYVSGWRVFFSFAQKMEMIVDSPLSGKRISFEIAEATKNGALPPPAILSVGDAGNLLRCAWEMRDKGMLQAVVVLLFGGLRPNAEMLKIDWDNIELDEGIVNIGGDRSKNEGSARSVKLCDAALEWLVMCPKDRFKPTNWYRNWKTLRDNAGLGEDWVEDMTRHSFASYSFGLHRDPDRLRRELGHVDQRMLNHYLQVSSAVNRNAKKYFGQTPDNVLGGQDTEIVEFQEAAG